jgi:hypothetical protein
MENLNEDVLEECDKDPNTNLVMDLFKKIQKIPIEGMKVYHDPMEFGVKTTGKTIDNL